MLVSVRHCTLRTVDTTAVLREQMLRPRQTRGGEYLTPTAQSTFNAINARLRGLADAEDRMEDTVHSRASQLFCAAGDLICDDDGTPARLTAARSMTHQRQARDMLASSLLGFVLSTRCRASSLYSEWCGK